VVYTRCGAWPRAGCGGRGGGVSWGSAGRSDEVVDVGWAGFGGGPGLDVVGFAVGVVGSAEDTAFVAEDEGEVLGVGGESCFAAEPEGLAVGVEDGADDVGVGCDVFGEDGVGNGSGADEFSDLAGVHARKLMSSATWRGFMPANFSSVAVTTITGRGCLPEPLVLALRLVARLLVQLLGCAALAWF